jgi:hypothetical protein
MHEVQYHRISHHKMTFLSYQPTITFVSELEIKIHVYQASTHFMAILVAFSVLLNAR